MNLLTLNGAEVAFGTRKLLDDAALQVNPRERLVLVGRNGAGKSTLLKVISGEQGMDDGERWVQQGLRISYLSQVVPDATDDTIYDITVQGLGDLGGLLTRYKEVSTAAGSAGDAPDLQQLGELEAQIDVLGGWAIEPRVNRVLHMLNLNPQMRMDEASGGLRRRAMLASALVSDPDLLLLDEPTNHLDVDAIDQLQEYLLTLDTTMIVVTHDRALVNALATRIVEVDRGQLKSYPGNYTSFITLKEKAEAEEANENRKFDKRLAEEERWIRQGIKARRTRNEGRVRRLESLRRERAARVDRQGKAKISVEKGDRSGAIVADLKNVSFGYGASELKGDSPNGASAGPDSNSLLLKDFSTTIQSGDRIGLIGANGSGKSTLIKLILGQLQPTSGTVTQGTSLQTAYFDQQRDTLDDDETVRRNIAEGADYLDIAGTRKHVVGYLGEFLFDPGYLNVPVRQLSGGEKNRLMMAKLFARPANLLVLDEPTNDLDVETLELLEEILADFKGTIILVSHDRVFLDRVVTSTIVFSQGGQVEEFVGGYSDWQKQVSGKNTSRDKAVDQKSVTEMDEAVTSQAKSSGSAKSKRLSYKDQRELDRLPEKIEKLEAELARLQSVVSEPDFYQSDPDNIKLNLESLTSVEARIESTYARWEELSNLE